MRVRVADLARHLGLPPWTDEAVVRAQLEQDTLYEEHFPELIYDEREPIEVAEPDELRRAQLATKPQTIGHA
jgi:hypothetical protein